MSTIFVFRFVRVANRKRVERIRKRIVSKKNVRDCKCGGRGDATQKGL